MLRTQRMDIYKFKKKLNRYLKKQSNETENALIDSWYKSYATNEQPLEEDEKQRIRHSINSAVKAAIIKRSVIQLPIFRIAATIVVATGICLLVRYFGGKREENIEFYTVKVGTNDIKQITLPDSSVIWLNAGSRVRLPVAFKGKLREVELVEGEAFFDIKRNPQHPFIVHTADLKVQVLGTSFNINAYKSLKNIKISVSTGKVGVVRKNQVLSMLLPDQQLCFDRNTSTYYQQVVNASHSQSWKTGDTYLTQASFEELALTIKNIYGLSLKAGSSKVNNYLFSLRIQHNQPADHILQVIGQIHNTHFRKEGNVVVLY
jgi:transmembrane sensor